MLSKQEAVVLENWRRNEARQHEMAVLADAMLRLYPPGWNDPVTPERLVELGGEQHIADDGNCVTFKEGEFFFNTEGRLHAVYVENNDGGYSEDSYLPEKLQPRNMQEARQLLERCGAIKEAK